AEQFREALLRDSQHTDSLHNLAVTRLRQGRLDSAERVLREALGQLSESASANSRAVLGQVLWRQGRRAEAAQEWKEAARMNPADGEALVGLGLLALSERRDADAARRFTEAIRATPSAAPPHSLLGVALGRQGRWQEALASQQRATDI